MFCQLPVFSLGNFSSWVRRWRKIFRRGCCGLMTFSVLLIYHQRWSDNCPKGLWSTPASVSAGLVWLHGESGAIRIQISNLSNNLGLNHTLGCFLMVVGILLECKLDQTCGTWSLILNALRVWQMLVEVSRSTTREGSKGKGHWVKEQSETNGKILISKVIP